MFDILAHYFFVGSVQCLCARDSVFCVCTLCFFTPYVWRALSLEGHPYLEVHIYLEGHIYLEAYLCLEGSSLV